MPYRLAVLRTTVDIESAFSALVKRDEQASLLTHGVDSLKHTFSPRSLPPPPSVLIDRLFVSGRTT